MTDGPKAARTTIELIGASGEIKTAAQIEREAIDLVTVLCAGNLTAVAARLGIGRTTLYRKLGTRPADELSAARQSVPNQGAQS